MCSVKHRVNWSKIKQDTIHMYVYTYAYIQYMCVFYSCMHSHYFHFVRALPVGVCCDSLIFLFFEADWLVQFVVN